MENLCNDLILEIFSFLSFHDISKTYCVSKEHSRFPKPRLNITTYKRDLYDGKYSYLLTNGIKESPGQLKLNHMEIRLYRYNLRYYFTFYYQAYQKDKNIFDFLKNIDWKNTRKLVIPVFNKMC